MAEVRLIDANAMAKEFEDLANSGLIWEEMCAFNEAAKMVQKAPTIAPESLRPKGRWEDMYGGQFDNPLIVCPVCKEPALEKSAQDLLGNWWARQEQSNYCPNCGAKMEDRHG